MENSKHQLILGLDLGVTSIGFALVRSINDTPFEIVKMGVRIVPLTKDDETEFSQGNTISKNRDRTLRRTQRKGLDRFQLRRKALQKLLLEKNMSPDKGMLLKLSPLEIWGIRAKAVTEKVSLQELGRILLHLNQKRGYKHSRSENTEDKKQTEYVQEINERYTHLKSLQQTIGQHFYGELKKYFAADHKTDAPFRIREKVFPRAAYMEEFDIIWKRQQQEYPAVLTETLYNTIRNAIIYYQRKLKSQKGLVNICEFEAKPYLTKEGKKVIGGPKVAPKSSPLFQVEKIWGSINNIIIKNKKGEQFEISKEKKIEIFDVLNNNEKLTQSDLYKILGIGKRDGYFSNELIRKKGIQGNLTRYAFINILGTAHPALRFDLKTIEEQRINKETGEVTGQFTIDPSFEKEPLYKLWHIIYSLEEDDCIKKLIKEFGFNEEIAIKLSAIDFTKGGFGNKSAKAIRKLIPYLQQGLTYDKACTQAGYNHSDSLTKEENLNRELKKKLDLLAKNSLNQPIVEKILNQLINLVNTLTERYGNPDAIRIELARELRQSREERNETYNNINKRERENEKIRKQLLEHSEFRKKTVSKRDIDRYRLWDEMGRVSPYEPGKIIGLSELFSGDYEIEHIIPRSLRFDDSFSNKTICHRRFNSGENAKNSFTAFDYMFSRRSRSDSESFVTCIEKAYQEKRISKTKYENLLMKSIDIPPDFINRQLNETRYISRKAKEILLQVSRNVYSTTGSITQRLRQLWGWDDILEQINLPKYRSLGLIEVKTMNKNGHEVTIERIKEWSKRDDHRHHAIDALVVACSRQGYIQRINTLNAQNTREEMRREISIYKDKLSLLDNYLLQNKPFTTAEITKHIEQVNISFKPGKKIATYSIRKIKKGGKKIIDQKNIIVPRGPLSEESVYGKIFRKITRTVKLDIKFKQLDKIINEKERLLVKNRLLAFNYDAPEAFRNLKKDPIWLDEDQKTQLTEVDIVDYQSEYVIKYPVTAITQKDLEHVVDKQVREVLAHRLNQHNNNNKEAFKDIINNPVWFNEEKKIPIKSVRCYTGISEESIIPIKVYDNTWEIEYEKYVKPANNHHVAIYKDEKGKLQEHIVTFWHAVERKKYGISPIIKKPAEIWDYILNNRELPQAFLDKLPLDNWTYITSMQQNECFVFGMTKEELNMAIENKAYQTIAPNVFRVRKLTKGNFWFNQQFETTPRESVSDKKAGRCIQASLSSMTGIKIKINLLGEIFIDE